MIYPQPRWKQRLPSGIVLAVALMGSFLLNAFWYLFAPPQWGLILDPAGPQSVQRCSLVGACSAVVAWHIRDVRYPSPAADAARNPFGLFPGHWVCAFQPARRSPFVPVMQTTHADQIEGASGVMLLSDQQSCGQKAIYLNYVPFSLAFIYFALSLLCAALAFMLWLHARRDHAGWRALVFLLAASWSFSLLPSSLTRYQSAIILAFVSAITITILADMFIWLLVRPRAQGRGAVALMVWSGSLLLLLLLDLLAIVAVIRDPHHVYAWSNLTSLPFLSGSVLSMLSALVIGNIHPPHKETARLLLWATIFGIVPFFLGYTVQTIFPVPWTDLLTVLTLVPCCALPLSLAYIILRRQILQIDTFIHRFAGPAFYLLVAFGWTIALLEIVQWQTPALTPSAESVVGMVLWGSMLLAPLMVQVVQWVVATSIFPQVGAYQRILREQVQVRMGVTDPQVIGHEILATLMNILPVDTCAVYWGEGTSLTLLVARGSPSTECLDLSPEMIAAWQVEPRCAEHEYAEWALVVPVQTAERLVACITLGPRTDGWPYGQADRDWLLAYGSRFAVALDYTQKVEEVHAALARQQELARFKDQIVATIHHELRTPLTSMVGFADLLGEMTPDEWHTAPSAVKHYAEQIATQGHLLGTLMRSLFQAYEVGRQIDVHWQRVTPAELVERVRAMLAMSGHQDIHERLQLQGDPLLQVITDPQMLEQIVRNLLSNAFKYSPPATRVVLRYGIERGFFVLSVRDHGYGIPEDEQQRIFAPFVRLERDITSGTRGTGLGLALVKSLAERLGGSIVVANTLDAGAVFTLRLPLHVEPA